MMETYDVIYWIGFTAIWSMVVGSFIGMAVSWYHLRSGTKSREWYEEKAKEVELGALRSELRAKIREVGKEKR